MAAATHNLVIEQGSTFNLNITWQDANDALVNLTGYVIRMQIRETVDADTTLVDFDSADLTAGQTIGTLDATGVIDVTLSDEVTAALDFVNGVYDLVAESSGGVVSRVVEGRVTFIKAVTR